jgi:poly-gamma-glutamate biosynthesis protein PgsC/CapC
MALYLDQPLRVLATLCVALLSLLSYRILSRYLILFGRRRFAVFILLGGILAEGWLLFLPRLFASPVELRVIGLVIPGLLANNLQKQKPLPTLASLGTASIVTYFLAKLATLL